MSRNKKFWLDAGISSEGHEAADKAMELMVEAVKIAGTLAPRVFSSAVFQVETLPNLTVKARKKFAWVPPKEKS